MINLDSYPENIKWDQQIDPKPLYTILDEVAENLPDNVLIDFFGDEYSCSDVLDLVNKAAAGFKKLGVTKGTKVGLFLPNSPQFIISYFAVLKAGGTVVNFSPLYSNSELKFQLEDSQTEIMITFDLEALYPKVKALLGAGKLEKIVTASFAKTLPFPKSVLFKLFKGSKIANVEKDDSYVSWDDLINNEAISDIPQIDPEEDIAVLQYTGGTTGTPKAAMLTHANVYTNAIQAGLWFSELEYGKEIMLGVLPFFHVFAMTVVMNLSILKGAKIIIHPRFEIENVLKDIDKKKPTLMPGVPTMFTAINNYAKLDKYDLSSLKACLSGGAPLPVPVKEKFEQVASCALVEGYGLTETSPIACANPIFGKNKAGSIGLPLPQTIIKIEDMENRGNFLGVGERGELCIEGPQVMKGYWQNPQETEEVLRDGLLRTGDIAKIDDEGYVYIVDRLKEMIIASGFKIYPRNIEDAIYKHEAVLEVAVIGIDDEYRGQTVKAVIALKDGQHVDADEMKEFLKSLVGKHEVPTEIEFRDELPKTMIGKISKKDL